MVWSRTSVGSHFARNPSANSRPASSSTAAETMRIGTSGFNSFISLAISVPALALRKWSAMTNSMGFCLKSSKPSSAELAVSTLWPTLASSSFLTYRPISASSIHNMSWRFAAVGMKRWAHLWTEIYRRARVSIDKQARGDLLWKPWGSLHERSQTVIRVA